MTARGALGAAVSAVLVLGVVAGAGLGRVWSTGAPEEQPPPAEAAAAKAGIDPDEVAATVTRRPRPVAGRPGALESLDARYRAVFDETGFSLTPTGSDAPFAVALQGLRRDDGIVPADPGRWRAEAKAARREVAPGVTEQVRVREGEVEWDLVLDRPLAGTGDLRVEATLAGPEEAGRRRGDGWRFGLPGGSRVRMGEVVVRDATGAELHRALPEVTVGQVRLVVPERILDTATYPLLVDPSVTPERALAPPTVASNPAVATDGTNHLVVWETSRGAIEGAVVNPSPAFSPSGFPVAAGSRPATHPAVAFDGTNFLVVWRVDQSSGDDIVGVRISPSGSRLDTTPRAISSAAAEGADPAVAFDGTNYLVVWEDLRTGTADVRGTRVSPAGNIVGASNFVVGGGTGAQTNPDVAFGTTEHLVVWADTRAGGSDIFGTGVNPAGTVLDPSGIAVSQATGTQRDPAVAFGGENQLVVWEDNRTGNFDIFGARVSDTGTNLDTAGVAISQVAATQSDPDVVFDGPDHLVVWEDARSASADVLGSRVSSQGTVRDPSGLIIGSATGTQGDPAVAFDGTDNLVVWRDTRSGANEVFGALVSEAGAVADPAGTNLTATPENVPAVAFDGTNFLVVWADLRFFATQRSDIVGTRVSPEGVVLDPAGLPIARTAGFQGSPAVAFNGSEYLVVFTDTRSGTDDVVGSRVTPSGAVQQAAGITIADGPGSQSRPAVASDGNNHLVVWQQAGAGGEEDIFGARVSGGGLLLDPDGFAVSDEPGRQRDPDVASDGTNRLVVWDDTRSFATTGFDIFAARVNGAGSVLDPDGIAVSTASGSQTVPRVASGGGNHLVVWGDDATDQVRGARVSTAGALRDSLTAGLPISQPPADPQFPRVAFNGTFLVAWTDRRSGVFDVFATRVNGNGQVLDGAAGFAVAASGGSESAFGASRGPGGTWGVTYRTGDPSDEDDSTVFLRGVAPK